MIEKISIKNFQAHKDTLLELHPGVNVITGASDSGKSSVIRSLLWSIYNRPAGDAFKNWYTKESDGVAVTINYDNGVIGKHRDGTKNSYQVNGVSYEALRMDVPEAVQEVMQLADYNIQTQFAPYFMLQDSPGERAKKLNDLVGISIIDKTIKNIKAKIALGKKEIAKVTTKIDTTTAELQKYAKIDSVAVKINKLYDDIDSYKQIAHKLNLSVELCESIKQIDEKIENTTHILKMESKVNKINTMVTVRNTTAKIIYDCSKVVAEVANVIENIDCESDWLVIEEPYDDLMQSIHAWKQARKFCNDINMQVGSVISVDDLLEQNAVTLNNMMLLKAKTLNGLTECPLCNTILKGE